MRERTPAAHNSDSLDRITAELAAFRYQLRQFLRFSESAAREAGVTPQQHQLLLGIAGFNGSGRATVSELAEFLQERHHSVVGLIDRAELSGLVRRESDPSDRRVVLVSLTDRGRSVLERLSLEHLKAVKRLQEDLLRFGQPGAATKKSGHTTNLNTKESHSVSHL